MCSEQNKLIVEKSVITNLKTELNCYQKVSVTVKL